MTAADPVQTTVAALAAKAGIALADEPPLELPHNRRLSPGVWRVRTRDGRLAALKHLRADRPAGDSDWDAHWVARDRNARRWNFWPREALAYRDGLTEAFAAAGLCAPARLGGAIDEREAVLVLEWVDGSPGEDWGLDDYGPALTALGRAQARFATGESSWPAADWLSASFLRDYSSEKPVGYALLDDDERWAHPMARAAFPAGLREGAGFIHAHRERLLAINAALPRTLCHLDFWPKNLVRRSGGSVVLLDWAFLGAGALGEDPGNLVPDACLDHFVAADELPRLEQVVFDAYLAGLRAGGWHDDPDLVRLGMWSAAVKYDWLTPLTLSQLTLERQQRYGDEGEIDAHYRFSQRGRALLHLAGWARRAVELADRLGI